MLHVNPPVLTCACPALTAAAQSWAVLLKVRHKCHNVQFSDITIWMFSEKKHRSANVLLCWVNQVNFDIYITEITDFFFFFFFFLICLLGSSCQLQLSVCAEISKLFEGLKAFKLSRRTEMDCWILLINWTPRGIYRNMRNETSNYRRQDTHTHDSECSYSDVLYDPYVVVGDSFDNCLHSMPAQCVACRHTPPPELLRTRKAYSDSSAPGQEEKKLFFSLSIYSSVKLMLISQPIFVDIFSRPQHILIKRNYFESKTCVERCRPC